jgi:hypothetical protein
MHIQTTKTTARGMIDVADCLHHHRLIRSTFLVDAMYKGKKYMEEQNNV